MPGLILMAIGVVVSISGIALVSDKDGRAKKWLGAWTERRVPEVHRDGIHKVLGWSYIAFGILCLGIGIGWLATH